MRAQTLIGGERDISRLDELGTDPMAVGGINRWDTIVAEIVEIEQDDAGRPNMFRETRFSVANGDRGKNK